MADQISAGLSSGGEKLRSGGTHVILAPRMLTTIQHVFEEEGLAGHVTLHQFAWEFIQLDFDLLSLEIPNFFRNQYLVQEWKRILMIFPQIRIQALINIIFFIILLLAWFKH